jgi:ATP-dependent RNA helicase DBP3
VLDEADRMLDQGFENDIRRIIGHCPAKEERQTVMCSSHHRSLTSTADFATG